MAGEEKLREFEASAEFGELASCLQDVTRLCRAWEHVKWARNSVLDEIEGVVDTGNLATVATFPEYANAGKITQPVMAKLWRGSIVPAEWKGELDKKGANYLTRVRYKLLVAARTKTCGFIFGLCTAPAGASLQERRDKRHFVPLDMQALAPLLGSDTKKLKVTARDNLTGAVISQMYTYKYKEGLSEVKFDFPMMDARYFVQKVFSNFRKKHASTTGAVAPVVGKGKVPAGGGGGGKKKKVAAAAHEAPSDEALANYTRYTTMLAQCWAVIDTPAHANALGGLFVFSQHARFVSVMSALGLRVAMGEARAHLRASASNFVFDPRQLWRDTATAGQWPVWATDATMKAILVSLHRFLVDDEPILTEAARKQTPLTVVGTDQQMMELANTEEGQQELAGARLKLLSADAFVARLIEQRNPLVTLPACLARELQLFGRLLHRIVGFTEIVIPTAAAVLQLRCALTQRPLHVGQRVYALQGLLYPRNGPVGFTEKREEALCLVGMECPTLHVGLDSALPDVAPPPPPPDVPEEQDDAMDVDVPDEPADVVAQGSVRPAAARAWFAYAGAYLPPAPLLLEIEAVVKGVRKVKELVMRINKGAPHIRKYFLPLGRQLVTEVDGWPSPEPAVALLRNEIKLQPHSHPVYVAGTADEVIKAHPAEEERTFMAALVLHLFAKE